MSWAEDWCNMELRDPLLSPQQHPNLRSSSTPAHHQDHNSQSMTRSRGTASKELTESGETWEKIPSHGKFEIPRPDMGANANYSRTHFRPCFSAFLQGDELRPEVAQAHSGVCSGICHNGAEEDTGEWFYDPIDAMENVLQPSKYQPASHDSCETPAGTRKEHGILNRDVQGHQHQQMFCLNDEKGISQYWMEGFQYISNGVMSVFTEKWIATLEPKKQTNYPYNGKKKGSTEKTECRPEWWPQDICFTGPQHVGKPQLFKFCVHLFMNLRRKRYKEDDFVGSAEWFRESAEKCRDRIKERHSRTNVPVIMGVMTDMLNLLRQWQRFDRGEIDGTSKVPVEGIPAKPTKKTIEKGCKKKKKGSGKQEKETKRKHRELASETERESDDSRMKRRQDRHNEDGHEYEDEEMKHTHNCPGMSRALNSREGVAGVTYTGDIPAPIVPPSLGAVETEGYSKNQEPQMIFRNNTQESPFDAHIAAQTQWDDAIMRDYNLHIQVQIGDSFPQAFNMTQEPIPSPQYYASSQVPAVAPYPNGMEIKLQTDSEAPAHFPPPIFSGQSDQLDGLPYLQYDAYNRRL